MFSVWRFLAFPTVIFTLYLYLYPIVHDCNFPPARRAEAACYIDPKSAQDGRSEEVAPFRLLALGDPQLEGDTSLPDPNAPAFPSLDALREDVFSIPSKLSVGSVTTALSGVIANDLPAIFQAYRKRLDLLGNDYYLAHVYRSVRWWADPTHTVVLGDLLGSQWIDDEEFSRRSDRFWNRVFAGSTRVPEEVTSGVGRHVEVLNDVQGLVWRNRLINVAGNHDIGYAGDLDDHRIERFQRTFGPVNWAIEFSLLTNYSMSAASPFPSSNALSPRLRLVVLNSMNMDSPAWNEDLQRQTRDFLRDQGDATATQGPGLANVLLTHVPLHKDAGICVDGPFFDYFPEHNRGGISEQNHLSLDSSEFILQTLFPIEIPSERRHGRRGVILNGHDHEGCDTVHYVSGGVAQTEEELVSDGTWQVEHTRRGYSRLGDGSHAIREITVRSMMGYFGGNAGLLSAWFDEAAGEWKFEYASCIFGIQHIWWAVHVLLLIFVLLSITMIPIALIDSRSDRAQGQMEQKSLESKKRL